MVVGIVVWELEIIGCQSLKDKRRVLKSLKERLRNRYNELDDMIQFQEARESHFRHCVFEGGPWALHIHQTAVDIARCVAMLCGPDAAWITGQIIVADGGLGLR